ncbi:MAG: energy-coupling factor ABC transporter ATP-binding protein [Bryobacteraceae bacterium]|nr:energy-coupling factor ABC transporter ATP-binding protein [Bryobacteraceae bacterium]
MSAALEVESLGFSFDGRRPVLRGVSFRLEPGDSLAVLGANGSGKSTLLWCILGLLKARGVVRLFGEPRTRRSLARIGVVFQNPEDQLFMPRLVEDLSLTLLNRGHPPHEAAEAALRALESAGLGHAANSPASQLSLGQRKRAAIAAALICRPELLVLDEPTAELDGRSARLLREHLKSLPVAKLIATHDLGLAREVCPRVLLLEDGAVLAEGPAAEILSDSALLERAGLI